MSPREYLLFQKKKKNVFLLMNFGVSIGNASQIPAIVPKKCQSNPREGIQNRFERRDMGLA